MSDYEQALTVYRNGRELVDVTRDRAVSEDRIRWAREDLEDVLLDLKLAVLDLDPHEVGARLQEARVMIAEMKLILDETME